ncbi:MAG: maleate cis-trans isomerase family protein [Paracoccaceae bacterium]
MKISPRSGPRIGVLVPYTNTNLEPDMQLLCPPGATVHFERMGGYDVDEIPGSDQMAGLGASDITQSLMLLSGVRPDVVLYGCTSATLTHGPSFDAQLARQIKDKSGALSITAAGALVASLQALQVTKIGFASPYLGEINDQAVGFLSGAGIETVKCHDVGRALGNYGQGELTPDEVFELAVQADHPEAQAIVLSCTDMRSVECIQRVETALEKPVVTSNQAMMFNLMRAFDLPRHDEAPGRLFDLL